MDSLPPSTRIVVVDDHSLVRELLKFRLNQVDDGRYRVVGEAGTGRLALEICAREQPDILLLDLIVPQLNGCEVMRQLGSVSPSTKVLFFSGATRLDLVVEAVQLGAAGFVSKLRPWQTVFDAVKLVAEGGRHFDPCIASQLAKAAYGQDLPRLTPREREVTQLIAESHSTKEIAHSLGISFKTADKHRTSLMSKLQMHDTAAITRFAVQSGIISVD